MSLTMHSASVPVYARMLGNLSTWIDKAAAHAEARKFDVAVLLQSRLYPDMLPFTRQVHIATDAAKGGAARLAGLEVPKWDDTEQAVPELKARIRRTIDFVQGIPADAFQGADTRRISVPRREGDPLVFGGEDFLRQWSLPNFFFHVTTAYAILRHNGVELGKADYLGAR
jgi:hypothetical protein